MKSSSNLKRQLIPPLVRDNFNNNQLSTADYCQRYPLPRHYNWSNRLLRLSITLIIPPTAQRRGGDYLCLFVNGSWKTVVMLPTVLQRKRLLYHKQIYRRSKRSRSPNKLVCLCSALCALCAVLCGWALLQCGPRGLVLAVVVGLLWVTNSDYKVALQCCDY